MHPDAGGTRWYHMWIREQENARAQTGLDPMATNNIHFINNTRIDGEEEGLLMKYKNNNTIGGNNAPIVLMDKTIGDML